MLLRGPWPGISLVASSICASTASTFSVTPCTLPPADRSTKGKVPANMSSPMCTTLLPVKKITLSPSVLAT